MHAHSRSRAAAVHAPGDVGARGVPAMCSGSVAGCHLLDAVEGGGHSSKLGRSDLGAQGIGPCLLCCGDRSEGASAARGRGQKFGTSMVWIAVVPGEAVPDEKVGDSLHALSSHPETPGDLRDAGRSVLGGVEDDPPRQCLAAERRQLLAGGREVSPEPGHLDDEGREGVAGRGPRRPGRLFDSMLSSR